MSPNADQRALLQRLRREIADHFEHGIVPFWRARAPDPRYGGFLVRFDERGRLIEREIEKSIISQTRAVWGFTNFYRHTRDSADLAAAAQGVDYLIRHHWDEEHGGWFWMTDRDGSLRDPGKVVYGIAFAIYALSEFGITSGDTRALDYACRTFDCLQKYAADNRHGGYFENLERDWSPCAGGHFAGDRKTLNTHMHLMEAFTTLYQATGLGLHRRRLQECVDLILDKMLHPVSGCCRAQFDLAWTPIPAVSIHRSWDFERQGTPVDAADETTCYGHNVEFSWLLVRAGDVLGLPHCHYARHVRQLCDHAVRHGVDHHHGGVFCAGPHEGPATNRDKEFWENMEVIPGFLDAFEVTGEARYLDAAVKCWDFSSRHLINHELGEWIFLAREDGTPLWDHLGNSWKINYHSGRSMTEALDRIDTLLLAGSS